MSQYKKNTEDKIREKLQSHEFDFSPTAWEQMEQMLDDPASHMGNATRDISIAPGWSIWLKGGLLSAVVLITALVTWYLNTKTEANPQELTQLQVLTPADHTQQERRENNNTFSTLPAPAKGEVRGQAQESLSPSIAPGTKAPEGQASSSELIIISPSPAGSPAATQSARTLTPGAKTGAAIGFSKQQSQNTQANEVSSAAQSLSSKGMKIEHSPAEFASKRPEQAGSIVNDAPEAAAGQLSRSGNEQANSQARFGSPEDIPSLFTPLADKSNKGQTLRIKPLKDNYLRRIQLGFSVGIISNNMTSNSIRIDDVAGRINQSGRRFFSVGLLARFPLDEVISLQTELNYYQLNSRYQLRLIGPSEFSAQGSVPIRVFSLPVMAQFSLGHGVRITGGLAANLNMVDEINLGISGTIPDFSEIYLEVRQSYKDRKLQGVFMTGIGYDWRRFSADLLYEKYLGSITNPIRFEEQEYRLRTQSSNVTLRFSYRFDGRRLLGR